MQFKRLIFIGFLFISIAGLSQENSIFWEVTGKNIKKPSYIFGTHHLHDYKFVQTNEDVTKKLKSVDAVVGEILIDSTDISLLMKMTMAMIMKDNSLDKLLNKQDYQATDKCLKEITGFGLAMLNKFKPIAVYQLIMVGKYSKILQVPDEDVSKNGSMDGYFQNMGKKFKKELKALETIDDQLLVLYDGYSMDRQLEMLLDMVYDRDSTSSNEIITLNQLYKDQNIEGLLKLMKSTTSEEEMKVLLDNRNANWIPQIEKLLESKTSAFIAVGAGHLPGDMGLIQLLRKKGYQLTPVAIQVQ